MRLLPLLVVLLAAAVHTACSGDRAAAAQQAAALADGDSDCNLQTKLVPGIPGSPGHLIASARNPNGDSELAAMMRTFVDDLRDARTLLEAKQPIKKLYPTHRKMRCAWMTVPDERDAKFDGRALGYLAAVRAFDAEPTKATFNSVLNGCIACHSQSCGGPIPYIDAMKWQ